MQNTAKMNEKKQFTTVKIDSTNTDGYGKVFIESYKKIRSVGLEIIDKTNRCDKFGYEWDKCGDFYGEFFIENPVLWSLSEPVLYEYRVEIAYTDGEKESVCGRFGFREIGENG